MRLWFTVAVLALAFCVVAKADNPYEDEDEYDEYERSPSNYGRGYNNKYEKRINYKNDESEDVEVEKKKDYSNTDKSRDRGIDITRKGLNLKRLQNDKVETKSKSFKGSEKKKSSLRYKEKSNPRYGYKNDEYKNNKYDTYRKNKYDDDEYKPNKYDNYKVNNYDNYKKKEYKKDDYKPKEEKYERKEKPYPKTKSYKPKEEKNYKPERYQKKTYKPSYSRPTYDSNSDSKKLSATMKPEEQAYTAPKYDDVEGIVIDNDNNNINKNAEESRSSNSGTSANANEERQEKKNEKLNYKENNDGSYRNKRN